jgi:hypothetical protein
MPRNAAEEIDSGKYLIHLFVCLLLVGLISAMVRALLPLLLVVAPVAFSWWAWRSYQRRQKTDRERLNAIFYELIQAHHGKTTVLDFAMTAQLSATEAKQFLNDRAREFAAQFEVSDQGDITYVFRSLQVAQPVNQTVIFDEACYRTRERSVEPKRSTAPSVLPLTQSQLSQRLSLSSATIRRKRNSADFSTWSQTKDPNGIAWKYSEFTQRFHPDNR